MWKLLCNISIVRQQRDLSTWQGGGDIVLISAYDSDKFNYPNHIIPLFTPLSSTPNLQKRRDAQFIPLPSLAELVQQYPELEVPPAVPPPLPPLPSASCPYCGASVRAGARFCPRCGQPLPSPAQCPACGASLRPGARFCPRCGQPLSPPAQCPSCGASLRPGARFCPRCGRPLIPSA